MRTPAPDSEWVAVFRRELQRNNLLYLLTRIEPPGLDDRIRLWTLLNQLESRDRFLEFPPTKTD